jgi:hypothetical protein
MKTATLNEVLEYRSKPYGGFLGNITFCDETYKDHKDLKDLYDVPPEVNKFCIVHGIDFIFEHEENLEEKLDNLLGEYSESYLIPSVYDGYIIWSLEDNTL